MYLLTPSGGISMEKHVRLLAIFNIVYGAFHVLAGLVGLVVIRWVGTLNNVVSSQAVGLLLLASGLAAVLLVFVVLVSIGCIIGGVGLLNNRRWARILVLVLSFLDLVHVPLGTALGVYGIWVLMNDKTDSMFSSGPGVPPQAPKTSGMPAS
jgi:hypothetical protein